MARKLRNFQGCHNCPKKTFAYWKSKKLEDNVKNIFGSHSIVTALVRRAVESSNVIKMFEMLFWFMFYQLQHWSVYVVVVMSGKKSSQHLSSFGFLKQSVIVKQLNIGGVQPHFPNEKAGMISCDKCSTFYSLYIFCMIKEVLYLKYVRYMK